MGGGGGTMRGSTGAGDPELPLRGRRWRFWSTLTHNRRDVVLCSSRKADELYFSLNSFACLLEGVDFFVGEGKPH